MTDLDIRPPAISEHFEIEGISFTDSIAHPVLGFYWGDFHDRLHWSKDVPDMRATEEGINLAILAVRFWDEDHRILAMPPPRIAAERVWDVFQRKMQPLYAEEWRKGSQSRGHLIDQIPAIFSAQTIHGSMVALENAVPIRRKIAALWNSQQGSTEQFEDYVARAAESVGRSAARFDPSRKIKFPTYAKKGIWGALQDSRGAFAEQPTVSLSPPDDVDLDSYFSFLSDKATNDWKAGGSSLYRSYASGGQRSALPVPSDDYAVERIVDRRRRWDDNLRKQIKAEANLNLLQEVVFENLLMGRYQRPWKDVADQLGISAKDEIYVLIARTKKKIRPVLHRMFFVRPKHD